MNGAPRRSANLLAFCATAALCAGRAGVAQTLRPLDLIENPTPHLGRPVEVEIVEPVRGPSTPADLARAEYGQVEVLLPDAGGAGLSLVPAAFAPADPDRYRKKFDRVLASPLRVRGEFLRDEEMSGSTDRPVYVIRVASAESFDPGPPTRLDSLAELASAPAKWNRKLVVYDGTYRLDFEISTLDGQIWLEPSSATTIVGGPSTRGLAARRVRATGILYAHPGSRYGHLGSCKYLLAATRLEYLP